MIDLVLSVLFWLLISFTVAHYTLKQFWKNTVGVMVVAAVFAVLFVVFVRSAL